MTQWAIASGSEFVLRLDESSHDEINIRGTCATEKKHPYVTLSFWRQTEVLGRYDNEPTVVDFVLNTSPRRAYEIGSLLVKAAKALDATVEGPANEEATDD